MRYIATYHTDVGISKKTNQDSLAIKVVETPSGQVAFGIVCDGMGGLSKGEVASREVILAFCDWFDNTLVPAVEKNDFNEEALMLQWNDIVQTQNRRLGEYGEENSIMLGTTVSAILMYKKDYYIVHVGDSRVYEMTDTNLQLTKDQTFIAREIAAGRMTPEQAKTDPRRSVLLQCVGASPVVEPEFTKGELKNNTTYMLCSDGFRHQITDDEMLERLGSAVPADEEKLKLGCMYLTELVKGRRETDNITVAVIRTVD
jgi:serine/threonine protein phosphatase PrpC